MVKKTDRALGPGLPRRLLRAVEFVVEPVVYNLHRPVRVADVHQHRYLDLTGGDHVNVDARVEQRLEHGGGHAGVIDHPRAHDGHLGDVVRNVDVVEADAVPVFLQQPAGQLHIPLSHGKADILGVAAADGL